MSKHTKHIADWLGLNGFDRGYPFYQPLVDKFIIVAEEATDAQVDSILESQKRLFYVFHQIGSIEWIKATSTAYESCIDKKFVDFIFGQPLFLSLANADIATAINVENILTLCKALISVYSDKERITPSELAEDIATICSLTDESHIRTAFSIAEALVHLQVRKAYSPDNKEIILETTADNDNRVLMASTLAQLNCNALLVANRDALKLQKAYIGSIHYLISSFSESLVQSLVETILKHAALFEKCDISGNEFHTLRFKTPDHGIGCLKALAIIFDHLGDDLEFAPEACETYLSCISRGMPASPAEASTLGKMFSNPTDRAYFADKSQKGREQYGACYQSGVYDQSKDHALSEVLELIVKRTAPRFGL